MRRYDLRTSQLPGSKLVYSFYEDNRMEIDDRTRLLMDNDSVSLNYAPCTRHMQYHFDSFHEMASHYRMRHEQLKRGENTGLPWDAWAHEEVARIEQARRIKAAGGDPPKNMMESFSLRDMSIHGGRENFSTHKTPEEFMEVCSKGFGEAMKTMQKMALSIKTVACSMAREMEIRFDKNGPEVDIDRLRRGDPDCAFYQDLGEATTVSVNGKVIDLAVAFNASWNRSINTMLQRGAAILCMIEALENAGYCVALKIYEVTQSNSESFCVVCDVKHPHQPVDVDTLSVALANGDVLRRLRFLLLEEGMSAERTGEDSTKYWSGYGSANVEECTDASVRKRRAVSPSARIRMGEVALIGSDDTLIEKCSAVPYSDVNIVDSNHWEDAMGKLGQGLLLGGVDIHTARCAKWLMDSVAAFGVEIEQRGAAV